MSREIDRDADELAGLYREGTSPQPPAELDATILKAARDGLVPWHRRPNVTLVGAAAVVFLAVGLFRLDFYEAGPIVVQEELFADRIERDESKEEVVASERLESRQRSDPLDNPNPAPTFVVARQPNFRIQAADLDADTVAAKSVSPLRQLEEVIVTASRAREVIEELIVQADAVLADVNKFACIDAATERFTPSEGTPLIVCSFPDHTEIYAEGCSTPYRLDAAFSAAVDSSGVILTGKEKTVRLRCEGAIWHEDAVIATISPINLENVRRQ